MELYVWEGDSKLGVPSMDVECLEMMLYVKFSGAPVTIKRTSNPMSSPAKKLPAFVCSKGVFTDFPSMTAYLRKQNYGCDHELSAKQCADVIAYQYLLKERLYPALLYLWWCDMKAYNGVTHPWYWQRMGYPWKLWVPRNMHQKHTEYVEGLYDGLDTEMELETQVLKNAQECITLLANKLGDQDYFFGRKASALDASIVALLGLLFKVSVPCSVLQNHIIACPALAKYVQRVLLRNFPAVLKTEQHHRKKAAKKGAGSTPRSGSPGAGMDSELSAPKLAVVAVAAVAANALYLYATGLLKVGKGEISYDDYSDVLDD